MLRRGTTDHKMMRCKTMRDRRGGEASSCIHLGDALSRIARIEAAFHYRPEGMHRFVATRDDLLFAADHLRHYFIRLDDFKLAAAAVVSVPSMIIPVGSRLTTAPSASVSPMPYLRASSARYTSSSVVITYPLPPSGTAACGCQIVGWVRPLRARLPGLQERQLWPRPHRAYRPATARPPTDTGFACPDRHPRADTARPRRSRRMARRFRR